MKKILVILGPTATGKTDLALQLALKVKGELVSADSRQIYKRLDIGTGKIPSTGRWKIEDGRWVVNGIPIHMYDVVSPRKQYTVAGYVKDAARVIGDIRKRGKLPIVVGGTGLYFKALLDGLPNLSIPIDRKLRRELEKLSINQLQEKLKKSSPIKWESMNYSDRQNPRRLIRAIELEISSRRSPYLHLRGGFASYDILKIGLSANREILYKRVDEHVISRINQGMIEEAKKLYKNGLSLKRMRQLGLEYGVLADYLDGNIRGVQGDQGLIKIIQGKIHGYIRRQLTWFKKEKDVLWIDITGKDFYYKVENTVAKWYHLSDDTEN